MPQLLIYALLVCALALPVLGAAALRVLGARLSPARRDGIAAAIFGLALVSGALLARGDVPSLQIGGLSILLPVAGSEESDLNVPQPPRITAPPADALPAMTAAPPPTGTLAETAASLPVTATSTEAPTASPAPTDVPTATPTPTDAPTAPPVPPPPAGRPTYTVRSGDTLKSIAEQFNVGVSALLEANNLTPEEADSLRVGQELVIP